MKTLNEMIAEIDSMEWRVCQGNGFLADGVYDPRSDTGFRSAFEFHFSDLQSFFNERRLGRAKYLESCFNQPIMRLPP